MSYLPDGNVCLSLCSLSIVTHLSLLAKHCTKALKYQCWPVLIMPLMMKISKPPTLGGTNLYKSTLPKAHSIQCKKKVQFEISIEN